MWSPLFDTLLRRRCLHCGATAHPAPADALAARLCAPCLGLLADAPIPVTPPPGVARSWCLGPYDGPAGALIRLGKLGAAHEVFDSLGARLANGAALEVDEIVPAPSPWWRTLGRGGAPTDALAGPLARAAGAPVRARLRHRGGAKQTAQGRAGRAAAASQAIESVGPVAGRILLVDDVRTTGATARACARELLAAGADEVWLMTAAVALS